MCTGSSVESAKVGQTLAIHCMDCYDGPSIGKCIEIVDTDIRIEWMKGTYTSKWETWMVADLRNKRRKVPWTDWVPKSSIILFDFELTPTKRLRKTTVEHLQRKYDELMHTNEQ